MELTFDVTQWSLSSPEKELAAGVIAQAVEDLYSPILTERREAQSFFTAGGEWKRSREDWIAIVGLDPDAVSERLGELLDDNPTSDFLCRGLTKEGTLASLPDRPFKSNELLPKDPMTTQKKLRLLAALGHLNQVDRRTFEKVPETVPSLPKHDIAA